MNSQEALKLAILEYEKDLEFDENNQWAKNVLKGLKKCEQDLEVLDIIKRSIYSRESHKYVLNEKLKGQKFMNVSLYISGDTDYNKVKEWLENGN